MLTYGSVFAAELVADKLLYTTSVLTTRYRAVPIVFGVTLAFMMKIGIAVLAGETASQIPRIFLTSTTTASFVWVAYVLWKKPYQNMTAHPRQAPSNGALVAFVLVLFSEWGDLGQITTATIAARFGAPLAVWLGAVCALASKGFLGAWLGVGVRRWLRDRLSPRTVRYAGVTVILLLAGLSVAPLLLGYP